MSLMPQDASSGDATIYRWPLQCDVRNCNPKTRERTTTRRRSNAIRKQTTALGFLVTMIAIRVSFMALEPRNTKKTNAPFGLVQGLSTSNHRHLSRRSLLSGQDGKSKIFTTSISARTIQPRSSATTILRRMTEFGRHQRENTVALRAVPSTVAVEDDDSTNGNSDDAAAVVGPAWKRFFLGVLTGDKRSTSASTPLQKPEWLSPSSKLSKVLPTWIFHLRPSVQLVATIFLYLFHTAVLTQNSVAMPFQLFPNDRGNFQSIGLDS